MTPEDHRWALAYLEGQCEIGFDDDDWPQSTAEVTSALVRLGAHVRRITAAGTTPFELAMNRLTYATDEMLAALLVRGDERADERTVRRWLIARAEVIAFDLAAQ